jgi:Flp pilus assembly protein TadD
MKSLLKFAVSSLVLGASMVGCKPASEMRPMAISASAPKTERSAAQAASKATSALAARDGAQAVKFAERAVELSPRDANHRALLGQAYLLAGRFASAEASLQDALSLDPAHGRAALSLALAETALGKADAARATLARAQGVADSDLGLAFALAGDTEGALRILEAAARTEGATAKTRQNLALAYALAGRWNEASATAAQDVPANELPSRLMKWAQIARPDGGADKVALLLGVTRATDPGQPVQLALAPIAPEPVALAAAEPPPEPIVPEEAAPVSTPEPVATAAAEPQQAAPTSQAAKSIFYATQVPASAPLLRPEPKAARRAPIMATAAPAVRKPSIQRQGKFVVQLGAYSSAQGVQAAWSKIGSGARRLGDHSPSSSTFAMATKTVHRLSVGGFATREEARNLCNQVKASGGDCFVRGVAGDAPVRWASAHKGIKLASR